VTRASPDRVVVTCAVTGNLATPAQTPHLPVTPEKSADACLGAGEAGAAVAHIHVREPGTGRSSTELGLYQDVVERIGRRNTDLILNITTGPGGRYVPFDADAAVAGPGTTLMHPEQRVAHIAALRPDLGTLDLNTMNSEGRVRIRALLGLPARGEARAARTPAP